MRIESATSYTAPTVVAPEVSAARNKPVTINPELLGQFNTVIKPKDKKNRVTEGELYAGVMYNRVLKHAGAEVAAQFLQVQKLARKSGKSLMYSAYTAWKQVDTFIERTLYPNDPKGMSKANKIQNQIRKEAIAGCQLDHNGTVSDPRKTNTSSGMLVSRAWPEAYRMAEENLAVIDSRPPTE